MIADAVLFNKAVNILKEHTKGQISVGKLASTCNVSVSKLNKLFAAYAPDRTPAQWGLRWLWDQKEVTVVLSGMNSHTFYSRWA